MTPDDQEFQKNQLLSLLAQRLWEQTDKSMDQEQFVRFAIPELAASAARVLAGGNANDVIRAAAAELNPDGDDDTINYE